MNAIQRIAAALRVALGFGDLTQTRLSPAHGWLLRRPQPAVAPRGPIGVARPTKTA